MAAARGALAAGVAVEPVIDPALDLPTPDRQVVLEQNPEVVCLPPPVASPSPYLAIEPSGSRLATPLLELPKPRPLLPGQLLLRRCHFLVNSVITSPFRKQYKTATKKP